MICWTLWRSTPKLKSHGRRSLLILLSSWLSFDYLKIMGLPRGPRSMYLVTSDLFSTLSHAKHVRLCINLSWLGVQSYDGRPSDRFDIDQGSPCSSL